VSLLLEDVLGRNVDLVTRKSLIHYIGPHILRELERVAIPYEYLRHMRDEIDYRFVWDVATN
jgi:hypothetical protein